jgi:hypothetical protein
MPAELLIARFEEMADLKGTLEYYNESKTIFGGKNRRGYVYGGNGEMYSREYALELIARGKQPPNKSWGTPEDYFLDACSKWFGRRINDCSGAFIDAIRTYMPYADSRADTLFTESTKKGLITDLPEVLGLALWKRGHIGLYVGNGWQIESRGTNYGVVKSRVSTQPWTHYCYLRDIAYEAKAPEIPVKKYLPSRYGTRVLKLTEPWMRGDDIKLVQNDLIKLGFRCGKLDGVYGEKTKDAVVDFQKSYFLGKPKECDGKVGDKTKLALATRMNILGL